MSAPPNLPEINIFIPLAPFWMHLFPTCLIALLIATLLSICSAIFWATSFAFRSGCLISVMDILAFLEVIFSIEFLNLSTFDPPLPITIPGLEVWIFIAKSSEFLWIWICDMPEESPKSLLICSLILWSSKTWTL